MWVISLDSWNFFFWRFSSPFYLPFILTWEGFWKNEELILILDRFFLNVHSSQLSVFIAVKCTACKWKLALSVVLQTMGVLSVCLMIMTFSIAAFFEQSKSLQCFISAEGSHSHRENLRLVTLKTFSYFSAKLIKM